MQKCDVKANALSSMILKESPLMIILHKIAKMQWSIYLWGAIVKQCYYTNNCTNVWSALKWILILLILVARKKELVSPSHYLFFISDLTNKHYCETSRLVQEKAIGIVTFTNVKPSSVQTTGNPGPSGKNRKTEEESFALGQTISKGKRHLIQRHSSFFLLFDPLFTPFTV